MNTPEIIDRLEEFDFDISLYSWEISPLDNSANHVTPLRVRDDHGLPGRQGVRKTENRPIVKDNDRSTLFSRGSRCQGRIIVLPRQTSDCHGNLKTNRIGSRRFARLNRLIFGVLRKRTGLARVIQFGGFFDRQRHGVPIMIGLANAHGSGLSPVPIFYFAVGVRL